MRYIRGFNKPRFEYRLYRMVCAVCDREIEVVTQAHPGFELPIENFGKYRISTREFLTLDFKGICREPPKGYEFADIPQLIWRTINKGRGQAAHEAYSQQYDPIELARSQFGWHARNWMNMHPHTFTHIAQAMNALNDIIREHIGRTHRPQRR